MNDIVIIGTGTLSKKIINGLNTFFKITVVGRNKEKLLLLKNKFNIEIMELSNVSNLDNKKIIICSKSKILKNLSKNISFSNSEIFSNMADIDYFTLKLYFPNSKTSKVIPNIAAEVNKSSTIFLSEDLNEETNFIFSKIGKVFKVENEKEMLISTKILSSGIAYLAEIKSIFINELEKNGINRKKSTFMVDSLFEGFFEISFKDEREIIKEVSTPGGITEKGIKIIRELDIKKIFL
ncbi:NAD(P)-binding domain-containing protein [archaeon]|jgi:pyrroline-5-carboxylate reductase|nr:NAD(P)-binding domain-containing protein [archaeon]MBT5491637.1 NAD(P)-binding domain-containing protein [bacterium]